MSLSSLLYVKLIQLYIICIFQYLSYIIKRRFTILLNLKINKSLITHVLHTCETWYHHLRKENGLKAFENYMLERKLAPKEEEKANDGHYLIKRSIIATIH